MKLGNAFSTIIPVESHTHQRVEPSAPEPVPDVGSQFGRPSSFSFSAEGAGARGRGRGQDVGPDGSGSGSGDGYWSGSGDGEGAGPHFVVKTPDEGPPEYCRIIRTTAAVIEQEARTEHATSPGTYVDVSRFDLLRFSYTEYPPKPTTTSMQPSVKTTFDLRFKLHPDTETKL